MNESELLVLSINFQRRPAVFRSRMRELEDTRSDRKFRRSRERSPLESGARVITTRAGRLESPERLVGFPDISTRDTGNELSGHEIVVEIEQSPGIPVPPITRGDFA